MKIEDIDKNFKASSIGDTPVLFLNALKAPFVLEGFPFRKKDGPLYRLPTKLTKTQVNEGALWLAHQTSGGAVRFRTDSKFIAVRATLEYSSDMNHMPRAGSAGFDLYCGSPTISEHVGTAQPDRANVDAPKDHPLVRMLFTRDSALPGMREWTLNLPLYGGVASLEIGLEPGCQIEAPVPHARKPVVFYGSSITQGGCASRPGNNYASMLCRAVDAEQVNLGFSGSGRGEIAVAKAIASIPELGAVVLDYDHNAPTIEHLLATHEPFFKAIREKHPDVPVLMVSLPNFWRYRDTTASSRRRDVIRATYQRALALGDRHVYFVDGESLFGARDRSACTVDGCHPNDLGFYRMYENILPTLQKAFAEA